MQKSLLSAVLATLVLSLGCNKSGGGNSKNDSTNNTSNTPKGGVLFWTSNFAELNTCGTLTIVLNKGQQANITGYYPAAPANCVNQVGGYFYLAQGQYTYTVVSTGNCSIAGGTVSVVGNDCNLFRIP